MLYSGFDQNISKSFKLKYKYRCVVYGTSGLPLYPLRPVQRPSAPNNFRCFSSTPLTSIGRSCVSLSALPPPLSIFCCALVYYLVYISPCSRDYLLVLVIPSVSVSTRVFISKSPCLYVLACLCTLIAFVYFSVYLFAHLWCELVLLFQSMFSGCMDCQTSADVGKVSTLGAGGACTNAMVHTLVSRVSAGVLVILLFALMMQGECTKY